VHQSHFYMSGLFLNSANVSLTTLYIFCFLFPQFLQNQGFVASISNENEIQVLILLGPFKFLVNYLFLTY
jgi:hypothetical protein